jgi:hypothetical protein
LIGNVFVELRPTPASLSFASPKESKQRKGDPAFAPLRYGVPEIFKAGTGKKELALFWAYSPKRSSDSFFSSSAPALKISAQKKGVGTEDRRPNTGTENRIQVTAAR